MQLRILSYERINPVSTRVAYLATTDKANGWGNSLLNFINIDVSIVVTIPPHRF